MYGSVNNAVIIMPNKISPELNRNICTDFLIAEYGAGGFRFVAFTRAVNNDTGLWITGIDCTLTNLSAAPDTNGFLGLVITDEPVTTDFMNNYFEKRRNGIATYLASTPNRVTEITRRYFDPIKLLSGRTYSVIAVHDASAVPTVTPQLFLTVFGYEPDSKKDNILR